VGVSATLRDALVQAAHLIADAIEAERNEPVRPTVKRAPPKPAPRKVARAPYVPANRHMSELERARARQAAKKAGIPVP
jgi:hypothetical protein